jgi:hypothetical protein
MACRGVREVSINDVIEKFIVLVDEGGLGSVDQLATRLLPVAFPPYTAGWHHVVHHGW